MLELEAALSRILAAIQPLESESIPLGEAHRRICAEQIIAALDLPGFDNSAMDGYAVRAQDVAQASAEKPSVLRQIGLVAAGETFPIEITCGGCVRVFTGSALPRGTDAVVMQEDAVADAEAGLIRVCEAVKPWENVRFRGEDVKCGSELIGAGCGLTAGRISLLASQGRAEVRVGRRPIVGVLATGSELCEPGHSLSTGQIYESNRAGLAALIRNAGARPRVLPLVRDTLADTKAALEAAFAECDIVVSSGGVSVGEFDFVKKAFPEIGGQLDFWRVAIRPGKPFIFGRWKNKILFGVPGNPVSAFVTFQLLIRPALLKLQGALEATPRTRHGILAQEFANPADRRHFVRVRTDWDARVYSAGPQASHCLGSLAQANGLLDVPPRTIFEAGKIVRVLDLE